MPRRRVSSSVRRPTYARSHDPIKWRLLGRDRRFGRSMTKGPLVEEPGLRRLGREEDVTKSRYSLERYESETYAAMQCGITHVV